eukprot:m.453380 g.453380  ORF g.453380 m.453380 type:complete len:89 (-) comp20486_c0_seq1:36-302(-)
MILGSGSDVIFCSEPSDANKNDSYGSGWFRDEAITDHLRQPCTKLDLRNSSRGVCRVEASQPVTGADHVARSTTSAVWLTRPAFDCVA